MGRVVSEPPAYEGASTSHNVAQGAPVQQQQPHYPPPQPTPQPQFQQQQHAPPQNYPLPPQQYQTSIGLDHLQAYSSVATCPRCGQTSPTKTRFKTGSITHIWALGLCFVTLLFCIPYCCNSSTCKDTEHLCGHCSTPLGIYHRASGNTQVLAHSRY